MSTYCMALWLGFGKTHRFALNMWKSPSKSLKYCTQLFQSSRFADMWHTWDRHDSYWWQHGTGDLLWFNHVESLPLLILSNSGASVIFWKKINSTYHFPLKALREAHQKSWQVRDKCSPSEGERSSGSLGTTWNSIVLSMLNPYPHWNWIRVFYFVGIASGVPDLPETLIQKSNARRSSIPKVSTVTQRHMSSFE